MSVIHAGWIPATTTRVKSRVTSPPKVGVKWRTVTPSVIEVDFKNGGVVMPAFADRRARAAEKLARLRSLAKTRTPQDPIGRPEDLLLDYYEYLPSIREAANHQQ